MRTGITCTKQGIGSMGAATGGCRAVRVGGGWDVVSAHGAVQGCEGGHRQGGQAVGAGSDLVDMRSHVHLGHSQPLLQVGPGAEHLMPAGGSG